MSVRNLFLALALLAPVSALAGETSPTRPEQHPTRLAAVLGIAADGSPIVEVDRPTRAPTASDAAVPRHEARPPSAKLVGWCRNRVIGSYGHARNGSNVKWMASDKAIRATDYCVKSGGKRW